MNGFENSSLAFPPILRGNLKTLEITYCYDLLDDALDRFLTKWAVPSGMDTLMGLYMSGNSLTRIPLNLPALDALTLADFRNNMQPMTLQTGDFHFRDMGTGKLQPIKFLLLDNSGIYYIEPGTFKGYSQFIFLAVVEKKIEKVI